MYLVNEFPEIFEEEEMDWNEVEVKNNFNSTNPNKKENYGL